MSNPIPNAQESSQLTQPREASLQCQQNCSPSDRVSLNLSPKFPIERSSIKPMSYYAKDLALPASSEPLIGALPTPAATDTATIRLFPSRFAPVRSSRNRCWKSPTACTYSTKPVRATLVLPPPKSTDPEIGDLRLSPVPDSDPGTIRIQDLQREFAIEPSNGALDPDLGILRLQPRPNAEDPIALPARPRQPSVFLLARADYFKSSNVFSDIDPQNDGLFRTGITLFYAPPIGPKTFVITSFDANLVRYTRLGQYRTGDIFRSLNYDELRLRAGIFHRITPRVSGEIGWSNQKLFASSPGFQQIYGGKEFFSDNSIRLELSRQDSLSPKLALNTFYQFRWSIAEPSDRSRILNSLIATLSYNFSQQFQTAIDYQFTWSHFTEQARDDLYHQIVGRLTYNLNPKTQFNLFSGFSFGSSTNDRINFNSFIFGAGIVFNLPLF